MQVELFSKPDTSRRAARSRAMQDARERADTGIERAMAATDAADPQWADDALQAVRKFAAAQAKGVMFTAELLRLAVERAGLRKPPRDARSWGGIIRAAAGAEFIERVHGATHPAASSNGSPKPVYRRGAKA